MSKQARTELLQALKPGYALTGHKEKQGILDHFVRSTGIHRKYAIRLFNEDAQAAAPIYRVKNRYYGKDIKTAIEAIWNASEHLCSKRLVPAIPTFLAALERHGHLSVTTEVREKLLTISPATVDRLLAPERQKHRTFGKSLTKPGHLLKKQIRVRTFADSFPEGQPGWMEADCVAHCGSVPKGHFLNSLTLTDIATGWTECFVLPRKVDSAVAAALSQTIAVLPFQLKGFDTDNGSEFINYHVKEWCENSGVDFTRSREYRKNDQAHVEEKNGSIVRRFIGYDRFEGGKSVELMRCLYSTLRLFTNYFRPTMKLVSKRRVEGKTIKKYDIPMTPADRLLQAEIPESAKEAIRAELQVLDPIELQRRLHFYQSKLFETAVSPSSESIARQSIEDVLGLDSVALSQISTHRHQLRQRRRHARVKSGPLPENVSVAERVGVFVDQCEEGREFSVEEIRHAGNREAVHCALRRLVRAKSLKRLAIGHYKVLEPRKHRPPSAARNVRTFLNCATEPILRSQMNHLGEKDSVDRELRRLIANKVISRTRAGNYRRNEAIK